MSLPKDQRQHRTLHIQKDVLPYALCQVLASRPPSPPHTNLHCWNVTCRSFKTIGAFQTTIRSLLATETDVVRCSLT